ncbi:MAG: hypothetical protein ACMXYK_02215 [Candidatus Woesearchaeota archaeon]
MFRKKVKDADFPTQYNLDIDVSPRSRNIPAVIYDLSIKAFRNAGFSGEKHVDYAGRLLDGFDHSCPIMHEGKYDIFGDFPTDESIHEIARRMSLTVSGYDETGMQLAELAIGISEILEDSEPLSSLPYNVYRQFSLIPGMEISTPAGIQGMHVHTTDGHYLRFFRPSGESQIYDLDQLKNYFFDKSDGIIPEYMCHNLSGKELKKAIKADKPRRVYRKQYEDLLLKLNQVERITL